MSNFFSFSRFCRLFAKHTAEHYRIYLMSVAVLAGVILLGGAFLFFVIAETTDSAFQTAVYVVLMLIAGTIFTSTVFSDFGDKNKAIAAITLPATAFEKFLVGWLYSFPIFLLVYTGVFYGALLGLSSAKHWEANQHFALFSLQQSGVIMILIIYAALHSIAIFGAIFFKKLHFIKTGFAFFIGYGGLLMVNTLLLKILTGLEVVKLAIPFGFLNFTIGSNFYSVGAKGSFSLIGLMVIGLTAVLIWVAAYFRLKEKQV